MKKYLSIILVIAMMITVLPIGSINFIAQAAGDTPITVYMVGDSTMETYWSGAKPKTGWGETLGNYLNANATVSNHAKGGRSSKSFIDEGKWAAVVNQLKAGDYVIIQFGHNDQKDDESLHTDPYTTYQTYLKQYVDDTKAKGATPIICTSIYRCYFTGTTPKDSLGNYPPAARQFAANNNVTLIDLHARSAELLAQYGVNGSKNLFMFLPAGIYENYPSGSSDSSHLQYTGADFIARLFARDLLATDCGLKDYVVASLANEAIPDPTPTPTPAPTPEPTAVPTLAPGEAKIDLLVDNFDTAVDTNVWKGNIDSVAVSRIAGGAVLTGGYMRSSGYNSSNYSYANFTDVVLSGTGACPLGKDAELYVEYWVNGTNYTTGNSCWWGVTNSSEANDNNSKYAVGTGTRGGDSSAVLRYSGYIASNLGGRVLLEPTDDYPGGGSDMGGWHKVQFIINISDSEGMYLSAPTVECYIDNSQINSLPEGAGLLNSNVTTVNQFRASGSHASRWSGTDDVNIYIKKSVPLTGVDKSALEAAILNANSVYNSAIVGTSSGCYSQADKDTLKAAIDSAQLVQSNDNATATDVAVAASALNAAVEVFKATVVQANKEDLEFQIGLATESIADAVQGPYYRQVWPSRYKEYNTALTQARVVYENEQATQAEVDAAKDALIAAAQGFKLNTYSMAPLPADGTLYKEDFESASTIADVRNIYEYQVNSVYTIVNSDVNSKYLKMSKTSKPNDQNPTFTLFFDTPVRVGSGALANNGVQDPGHPGNNKNVEVEFDMYINPNISSVWSQLMIGTQKTDGKLTYPILSYYYTPNTTLYYGKPSLAGTNSVPTGFEDKYIFTNKQGQWVTLKYVIPVTDSTGAYIIGDDNIDIYVDGVLSDVVDAPIIKNTSAGVLLETLQFQANAYTGSHSDTSVGFAIDNIDVKLVDASASSGTVYTPGDINMNGIVDVTDITLLSQYCAGWTIEGYPLECGDVNDDGSVDVTDATILMQYCAGWNVVLK